MVLSLVPGGAAMVVVAAASTVAATEKRMTRFVLIVCLLERGSPISRIPRAETGRALSVF